MKVTSKARALLQLRQILQKSTRDTLGASRKRLLSDTLPPNPDELSPSFADTRMLKQRNACLSAEFRRVVREDPPDTTNLSQELNAFRRNFALIDKVGFPDIYNVEENDGGIQCRIVVENCGKKYCWGKDNADPIVMELSLTPSSDLSGENSACTTLVVFDTGVEGNAVPEDIETDINADNGKQKCFPLSISHDELFGLEEGEYIASVRIYESELEGRILASRDKKFLSRSGDSWVLRIC